MPSDKNRLYMPVKVDPKGQHIRVPLGLHLWANSRGAFSCKGEITFVGQPPTAQSVWQYDELEIPLAPTSMLLVRVVVGKMNSTSRLQSIFQGTPLRPEVEG
ncbi:uncharacterized protein BCR38DRAFT_418618 [Pseudomassariella vexata]|uniref:Uncharacterized protein n=1 Tax=Pseudomassariella vexata TaxID=1141098 RepID=A0A1Y2EKE0_9PEZI|nr:uncharacterized protein BCR38DRAFT_418618 [Pseudomassariella vexata]ORY72002.1 hypothetical protein BCR38DRAFT_418618 [Pseudomassariella vexata]